MRHKNRRSGLPDAIPSDPSMYPNPHSPATPAPGRSADRRPHTSEFPLGVWSGPIPHGGSPATAAGPVAEGAASWRLRGCRRGSTVSGMVTDGRFSAESPRCGLRGWGRRWRLALRSLAPVPARLSADLESGPEGRLSGDAIRRSLRQRCAESKLSSSKVPEFVGYDPRHDTTDRRADSQQVAFPIVRYEPPEDDLRGGHRQDRSADDLGHFPGHILRPPRRTARRIAGRAGRILVDGPGREIKSGNRIA